MDVCICIRQTREVVSASVYEGVTSAMGWYVHVRLVVLRVCYAYGCVVMLVCVCVFVCVELLDCEKW